jgi:hypothetical protein
MTESSENIKSQAELLKENVIRGNEEFLLDLEAAQSIDDLIDVVGKNDYVDAGEHVVFEVGNDEDGKPDMVGAYPVDEIISALVTFKNDTPSDALGVDEWFDHKDINKAIKRILGLT